MESTQPTNTGLAVLNSNQQLAVKIDTIIKDVAVANQMGGFQKVFAQANAVSVITDLFTEEVMKDFKALQGNKIGFKTDGKYGIDVLRTCIIEATLYGLQVVGNHFNIIAGNMYITKEGFTYLLNTYQGLWYEIVYDLPRSENGKTLVGCEIFWKLDNSEKKSHKISFPVKVNNNMGTDAILGKAERKGKKWLYEKLSGNIVSDGEVAVDAQFTVVSNTTNSTDTSNSKTEEEEVIVFTEEEQRALDYINASENSEDLETRWEAVKKWLPDFPSKYYEDRKAHHTHK